MQSRPYHQQETSAALPSPQQTPECGGWEAANATQPLYAQTSALVKGKQQQLWRKLTAHTDNSAQRARAQGKIKHRHRRASPSGARLVMVKLNSLAWHTTAMLSLATPVPSTQQHPSAILHKQAVLKRTLQVMFVMCDTTVEEPGQSG